MSDPSAMAPPHSPALSTTSSSNSTTATIIDTHPNPKSLVNLSKQLKYLFIGLCFSLYFQVPQHLSDALSLGVLSSCSAQLALISLTLLAGTIVIFTHIVLLPARGENVNYVDWNKDKHLGKAIPALTVCIIVGWGMLFFTLSPMGAPSPPPVSVRQRLAIAAQQCSGGLDSLQGKINAIPSSFFPKPTTTAGRVGGDGGDVKNWDRIASYLSPLTTSQTSQLQQYFLKASQRAEEWTGRNIKVIGWTGALLGSIGSYLAVFGAVGLVGFVAPDRRVGKSKTF